LRWKELNEEDAAVAALLRELDHGRPVASAPTWLQSRPRRLRRALLTAAAAATLTVAAAATIIPTSPLHRWINDRRETRPSQAKAPTALVPLTPTAPLASGISVRAPHSLTVRFRRDQYTGVIEIAPSRSSDVIFRSRGGTTAYQLGAGQVSIDNQVPAQTYLIDLPAFVQRLRILVGNRVVFRWPDDSAHSDPTPATRPSRIVLDLSHPDVP
jgi:hypothetical protein